MNDSPASDMLRPQRPQRPTDAEIDAVARFNVDRQGPIPGPGLLAKFQLYDDFARFGRRVIDVLSGEGEDDGPALSDRWVAQGVAEFEYEDGGRAAIAQIDGGGVGDAAWFVSLQSWCFPPLADALQGKRVRVTVEALRGEATP